MCMHFTLGWSLSFVFGWVWHGSDIYKSLHIDWILAILLHPAQYNVLLICATLSLKSQSDSSAFLTLNYWEGSLHRGSHTGNDLLTWVYRNKLAFPRAPLPQAGQRKSQSCSDVGPLRFPLSLLPSGVKLNFLSERRMLITDSPTPLPQAFLGGLPSK